MRAFLLGIVLVCAAGASMAASVPQFVFHKGDVLTYTVKVRDGSGASLDGTAVLTVLSVEAKGTARISLFVAGSGLIDYNNRMTRLQPTIADFIIVVKPDGTIADFLNSRSGKSLSPKERYKSIMSPDSMVGDHVAVARTLFGLQLPHAPVAVGGKWAGQQQDESATSSDLKHWETHLTPRPVTYTFAGMRQFQGRNCMVIRYGVPAMNPDGTLGMEPTSIFFDAAAGLVVGTSGGEPTPEYTDTVILKSYAPNANMGQK